MDACESGAGSAQSDQHPFRISDFATILALPVGITAGRRYRASAAVRWPAYGTADMVRVECTSTDVDGHEHRFGEQATATASASSKIDEYTREVVYCGVERTIGSSRVQRIL